MGGAHDRCRGTIAEVLAQVVSFTVDPTMLVLDFVVGLLAAFLAYRSALRYRARFGVTPWNWPAGLWSFVFFLSVLIGLVLYLIARVTTRTRANSAATSSFSAQGTTGTVPDLGHGGPPPALYPPSGWYPDPSGRHEHRYWDGKGWTAHVSTGGVHSEEPLPS